MNKIDMTVETIERLEEMIMGLIKAVKDIARWILNIPKIKVQLEDGAYMPEFAHAEDAGMDIRTPITVTIQPGETTRIWSGVHMLIPWGFEARLANKSGIYSKDLVCDGLIDAGYTGQIGIVMHNRGKYGYTFAKGDKLTQIVISKKPMAKIIQVDEMPNTQRGAGGFGSTGK